MYKLIQNSLDYFGGEPLVSKIDLHDDFLTRHASSSSAIAEFVRNLKPREDGVYIHINALGGPHWGCNANGDFFEKDVLAHACPMEECDRMQDYGYKTFMKYAFPYKHHVNKDPNLSIGEKVAFSTYNDRMDRVELVCFIKKASDPELVSKIERNEAVPVSMGTKVLYDVCSICGNPAKKREEYCDHLKYAMKQILPDGRQVYAINKYPRFFDISFVLIPAEKASYVMDKVASLHTVVPSVFIADALGVEEPKRAQESKSAEIKKEIPIEEVKSEQPDQGVIQAFMSLLPKITASEPNLSMETIGDISKFPLKDILSTMSGLGMVAKPEEFHKIIIIKRESGVKDESPDIDSSAINDDVIDLLKPYIVDRSSFRPALRMRVIKLASQEPVRSVDQTLQQDLISKGLPTVAGGAALYDLYRTQLGKAQGSFFLEALEKNPILVGLLSAAAAAGIGMLPDILGSKTLEKSAAAGTTFGLPTRTAAGLTLGTLAYPYLVGAHKKHKLLTEGEDPGDVGRLFIKHPGTIGLLSLYPAFKLLKGIGGLTKVGSERGMSIGTALRFRNAITMPLIEDDPKLVDTAIVYGFANLI